MIGLSGTDLVTPGSYPLFEQFVNEAHTEKGFQGEAVDIRKDGSLIDISVKGVGFNFRNNLHLLAVVEDITERKHIRLKLQKSEQELRDTLEEKINELAQTKILLDKKSLFAELGRFMNSVAHELKNPLGTLNNTLQHMEEVTSSDKIKGLLKTSRHSVCRCSILINELMCYTKTYKLAVENIDVGPLIRTIIKESFTLPDIRFAVHGKKDLHIEVDEIKLEQVLINIFQNSVNAFHRMHNYRSKYCYVNVYYGKVAAEKDWFYIKISNNGPPIPKERLKHIFEPFYPETSMGMGLGLAITQKIVETHRGKIVINNRKGGEGVITSIFLPIRGNNANAK